MKYLAIIMISMALITCSSSQIKKEDEEWKNKLKRGIPLHLEGKVFDEKVDFFSLLTSFDMGKLTRQANVQSPIYFKNCTFNSEIVGYKKEGNVTWNLVFEQAVVFEDCYFEGEINFRGAVFKRGADFTGSVFKQKATLEEVRLHQTGVFTKAIFEKEVRMQNVFAHEELVFKDAQTKDIFSLQGMICVGDLNLSLSKHFGYFDLSRIRVDGSLLLNYTTFNDRFLLSNSMLKSRVDCVGTTWLNGEVRSNVFGGKVQFAKVEGDFKFDDNIFLIPPSVDASMQTVLK